MIKKDMIVLVRHLLGVNKETAIMLVFNNWPHDRDKVTFGRLSKIAENISEEYKRVQNIWDCESTEAQKHRTP